MKRYILSTLLLSIFAVSSTYAGTLKFNEGTRTQSYLLSVSSRAIPMVIDYNHDGLKDLIIGDDDGSVWFYQNFDTNESPDFSVGDKILASVLPIDVISKAAPYVVNWDNQNDLDLIVGNGNGKIMLFASTNSEPFGLGSLPTFEGGVSIEGINSHPNATPFVADWDDDNRKDLIIGDASGNVWVYQNTGKDDNPLFTQGYQVKVGTGTEPLSVENDAVPRVVDWDGDGNKDLVVGNGEGEVYVFLSGTETPNGTPTFTIGKNVQANNKDIDVGLNAAPFVTDWNNSGNIDLLVGEGDGSLNLYLNSGDKPPTFSILSKVAGAPSDLDAGSRVIPFVTDFDSDGRKDLIVGDANENGKVRCYLNSGEDKNPKFTDAYIFQQNPATPTDISISHASPYLYDWNQDGFKDLIVGDEWGHINIFYGTQNTWIFKVGTLATMGTGTNAYLEVKSDATPIVCDWNNDGRFDLVVGNKYGNVFLFLNSGTWQKPAFAQYQGIPIQADGNNIDVVHNAKPYIVYFDNDDKKDLVIGNSDGKIQVYLNTGSDDTPVFTTYFQVEANSHPLEVSGYAAPVVVDWNNDNTYDLIVGEEEGYINIYTGIMENSPPEVIPETPVGTQNKNVTIYYTLKDDERDVCSISVQYSSDYGNTWTTATRDSNAGDGVSNLNASQDGDRHSFVWDSLNDLGNFVGQVLIKIIPNDGKVEGESGQTGRFGVDNVNEPKWEKIKINGADLWQDAHSTPIVDDWDEDGKRDLLIGGENGYVYFCQNTGSNDSPDFEKACPLQTGTGSLKVKGYSSPFIYDWDSTGGDDLLVGDGEGYVTFYKNTGDYLELAQGEKIKIGTQNLKVSGNNAIPVVVDWNSDGYKDLLVGDGNGYVNLYLNKNSSGQDTSPSLSPGVRIQANSDLDVGDNATPYVFDWDNDYKDDLIIGNSDGYVWYYKNIGSEGTPSFNGGVKIKVKGEDIEVDDNSRPAVMNSEDEYIDLIVGSKAGYVFLYHLTREDLNTPPQMTITNPKGSQSTQTAGSVTITYTLQDDDWNECNIQVDYSTDGQFWYLATGTPKTNLESSPSGISQTFTWFSKQDILATKTYVSIRIIPNDGKVNGAGATATVSFYLRNQNNLPMVSNVGVRSLGNGQVEVSYDLQDADNDSSQVFVKYQGGSVTTWATATFVGTTTDILPAVNLKLIWLSSVDERHKSAKNYQIKVTPFDIEYGTSGISTIFEIDNSSLSSGIVPAGTITTLSFSPTTIELLKPFSPEYDVLITVDKNPQGILPMNTIASLNNTVRKISAFKLPDITPLDPPSVDAKITIPYDDLNSYEQEMLLKIFELRENKWVVVGGTPDVVNNRVTVQVEHFSVFRIGLYAVTLNEFSISPNPFKDNDGVKENGELGAGGDYEVITFQGVSKVKIYTIAGELVRESSDSEIDDSGCWRWDLRNDYGRLVGSGIYIYVANDSTGASLVGKLGVIR